MDNTRGGDQSPSLCIQRTPQKPHVDSVNSDRAGEELSLRHESLDNERKHQQCNKAGLLQIHESGRIRLAWLDGMRGCGAFV